MRKYFAKFVSNDVQDNEVWFDSHGAPLKWHYPIGKFVRSGKLKKLMYFSSSGVLLDLTGDNYVLPWNITIHFSKFPEETIFRCPNK